MVSKKALIFFVAILLYVPEKFHCKFDKIEQYLVKYEVSNSTEITRKFRLKFPTFENAERSIEIKGFGKSFILDLFIYFHHEDANIEYISKELNSTGRYQDLSAMLYQGHVRGTNESFALGFFTQNNLFRGYIMTDEVYCVEPHEDEKSVIIYKLSDVIFPGCSKTAKGDGLDCSKAKYFEPWKPSKPRSKEKFDYRFSYDEYLKQFSDRSYQKAKNKPHLEKYNSDSKTMNMVSDGSKDDHKTGEKEKNSSSTAHSNEDDFKHKNHHNDTGNEHGNEKKHHRNNEKNEYDKKKSIKIIDTNHRNDTIHGEENSSEKYEQNQDELRRWLSLSNRNNSEINNETDHTHENNYDKVNKTDHIHENTYDKVNKTDHTHENTYDKVNKTDHTQGSNDSGVNKTHSDVDRDHEEEDDDDDEDKIHLSKYATNFQMKSSTTKQDLTHASHSSTKEVSFESSQNIIESSKSIESPDTVSKDPQITSQKDRYYDSKEEINDLNSVDNVELFANSILPNENFPAKPSEHNTSASLNSILYKTENPDNNLDNSVNDISLLKSEEKEKEFASFSPEKKIVQKRQVFEELDIPYASIERIDFEPVQLECNLEILISPAFRKKFNNVDADAMKDIFTQITLVNKLFQKVVLKRKGMPFHAIFRIGELVVYKDEAYSPFHMKGEMEDVVRYFNLQKRSCLSIGLMNKILRSPMKFVDGYLPKDDGGACARTGNFFLVSHGDEVSPAPMGLYLAALIRGFTRGFGATDESEKCRKGNLPNPLQELRDNLLTKQITPGKKYATFTECNIQDIEKGLKDRKCLVEIKDPVCGNAIVDAGEECDCGPGYICQRLDPCCKPHLTAEQKMQAWLADGSIPESCRLVSEAQCGMSQQCCDNCFVRPGVEKLCHHGTGLCDQAYCDGKHANCPSSANASENLVCNEFHTAKLEPMLCRNKQCDFGLCTGVGLTPCVCAPDSGKECLSCCLKDGKCKAAVSDLQLIEGEEFPLPNGVNCTGGLCFRGKCVLEAGIQATNASGKNPAPMIRSNKVLMALNSVLITVITLSVLLFLL